MTNRLRFNTAAELFEAFPTVAADMLAKPTSQPSLDFLRGLVQSPTPEEAVTFCGYLLPRRVAVWWGHQCLTRLPGGDDPGEQALLALAEDWVREPDEERRYAALNAGMAPRMRSAAAWICLGAGWSGGSLAPSGMAPVVPAPHLTARAVNAGILTAVARAPAAQRGELISSCVAMGISFTEG